MTPFLSRRLSTPEEEGNLGDLKGTCCFIRDEHTNFYKCQRKHENNGFPRSGKAPKKTMKVVKIEDVLDGLQITSLGSIACVSRLAPRPKQEMLLVS